MEVAVVKAEVPNGTPLPQRQINKPQNAVANDIDGPEKPRFGGGNNSGGANNNQNRNNQNNQNNRGFGNRNRNRNQGNNKEDDVKIPNLMNLGDGGAAGGMGAGGGSVGGGMGGGGGGMGGGGGNRGNRGGNRGGGENRGHNRDDNRNRAGADRDNRGGMNRKGAGDDYMINLKMKNLNGPTHELPPIDTEESKFSGRNRLYIGNLTNDVTEEELRELFKPYGEISEAFINADKNFAFLKVDYHANAERAKRELDGSTRKNRQIRIRFAPNATIIRVKNLTPMVSNELLFKSFELFGPVERAVIVVDDRGKPTGDGIVEFARKAGANMALRYCSDKCFFLTASLRPCVAEPFEINDDTDGLPDKSMNKKTQEFFKARQVGPRFAEPGSFEHEYGTRWKQLHELFKQKHEALKRELLMEEEKLEAQMEFARYEHETELLRVELRQREQDRDRQKLEWEMRERQCEELRTRDEEQMRRQQDDMQIRMNRQDDELRRRQQENTLFMQAQQLNSLLDQQEISEGATGNAIKTELGGGFNAAGGGGGGMNANNSANRFSDFGDFLNKKSFHSGNNPGGNNAGNQDQGFMASFEFGQNNQQAQGGGGNNGGGGQRTGNMNRWNDRRSAGNVGGGGNGGGGGGDDFQNKRRRF